MADKLRFELVSPERVLASDDCDMVVMPGEEGDLGILVEHSPLVALLRPGVVEIYQGDKIEKRLFVSGGFAEVNPKGCILLAEEGIPLDGFAKAEAERRLDMAKRDLADVTEEGPVKDRAEHAVKVAEALVAAFA
ncbi:MAG: ATP synthase F1 subunit epsilon [Geminicoccaceae bacterium]|nr:MAG: ATP synthase F1 subunit epsilon [Geminicoccaceae bacterium]